MKATEKKTIRDRVLRLRGKFFSSGQADEASKKIIETLKKHPSYQTAQSIMCFVSFGTEVHTHEFLKEALAEGKRVFVPYIKSKAEGMNACEIKDFSELELGYFNILTPKEEFRRITSEEPDLVIVPAVAYDLQGYRVGYGGGFYDRYLGQLRDSTSRIGIGFSEQVVDKVPVESFDQPIDILITPEKIYTFR